MNESVEYVIRVILRARDDLSAKLSKIREEIRELSTDADNLQGRLLAVNTAITSMNDRARNATKSLGNLKKATDDLGGSVEKFNKLEEDLAKAERTSEEATHRQRDAMGRKVVVVKDLGDATDDTTKSEKENAIAQQLSRISTEKSTEATKKKTAASKEAERAARKEVDRLLVEAYRDEAAANTERAQALTDLEKAAKLAKRELRELKELQGIGPRVTSERVPKDFDPGMLEALRKAEQKADDAVKAREEARRDTQKVRQEAIAERVRAAGGVPAAEDPRLKETEKQLGIARREERKAKRELAEAQEESSKIDLETTAPAELARLKKQQETLERAVRVAGNRVSNAFRENKEAQEAANKVQREALVQHVLAMQASEQKVAAEKKEADATNKAAEAVVSKSAAQEKAAGTTRKLTEQQAIDRRRAAEEAAAAEDAISKQRFVAREFGESNRRFQVFDTQVDKVVKRLGSLSRAEEEAAKANQEHQRALDAVAASTADAEGISKRFEETTKRQEERLKKMAGGEERAVKKVKVEIEPEVELDEDALEAAIEEKVTRRASRKKKVKPRIELDEPEVDLDWDPDEILKEAMGFEHMEEEGFDITPHIHIQSEAVGHFAEQETPFAEGLGMGGGSPEIDRQRSEQLRQLYSTVALNLKEASDKYKSGNLSLERWHQALERAEHQFNLLTRKTAETLGSESELTQSIRRHANTINQARERIGEEIEGRRGERFPQTPESAASTFLAKAMLAIEQHRREPREFQFGIGIGGGSKEADEGLRKLERDHEAEHKLRQKQQNLLARLNAAYEDQRSALNRLFHQFLQGTKPAHEFVLWLEEAEKATRRMARQATGLGTFDPEATARLTKQAEAMEGLRTQILEREERKAGKAKEEIEAEGEAIKKTTTAYEQHDGTMLEVEEDAIKLHDRFRQLKTDFDEGRVSSDDARESFELLGRQLRKLATSSDVEIGSLTQHGLFALAREPEAAAAQIREREQYVAQVAKGLNERELRERAAASKRVEDEEKATQKARDDYVNIWEKGLEARALLERNIARQREERDKRALAAAEAYDRITRNLPPDLVNLDDRDLAVLSRLKRELDQVANSYDNLSEEQVHFTSLSRLTNRVIQEHTQALRDDRRALNESANATERAAARDRLAASARARFGDASGIRAISLRRADQITPEDRVALQDLAKDLRKVAAEHEHGSDAQRHYASMAVVVEDAVKRVSTTLNEHERNLRNQRSQIGGLTGVFDRMSKAVNRSGDSVAALDNRMQGMIILAVMAFAQQFISVLVALAGTLGAVASSALFAAGAIGGSLVAGIAQALPVVGLLVATMARVKSVMEAVQQADLVQQQGFQRRNDQSKKLADTTNAVANAQDGLRSATDSLGDAHRRVADAQENLTKARADAARQLRDLILAEKDAELAARGAALNQEDAQQRILDAVATGQGNLDQLNLDFDQATFDRQRSGIALSDVRTDLRRARRGGVEGSEEVVQAKQQVEDAKRSVTEAERAVQRARRGIDQARRSADAAAVDSFAGAEKLQFLLQQLTPAEREFYRAALRLREQYREVFRPVTDILIRELTKGTNDLTDLLRQPKIGQAARSLANSVASQMSRVRRELFDPEFVDQLLRIVDQSKQSLKPVTDIIINLGHSLANIAEAAGPAFERILGWFDGLSGRIRNLTEDRVGLEDFFDKAADNAIAWFDAIEAVIVLIGTIAGVGADTGLSTIEGFTDKVKEWTEWIDSHRPQVQQFFQDSVDVAKQLFRIVGAIAEVIVDVNDPESVKPLVDIIVNTVIPAMSDAIKIMGILTRGILFFLNLPGVGRAVEALVMIALISKVLRTTNALLGTGIKNWRNLARVAENTWKFLNALTFGGLNKAIGGITTVVGNLIGKFPGLKKLGDKLKEIGDRLRGRGPGGGPGGTTGPGGGPLGPDIDIDGRTKAERDAEAARRRSRRGRGSLGRVGAEVGEEVLEDAAVATRGRGGLLSRLGGLVRGGGLLRGAAGVGAKLGVAGLAVDFGINLIDSNGNPLKATQNTASDLTFGLIPRAKDTDGTESKKPVIEFGVDTKIDVKGTDVEKRLQALKKDIDKRSEDIDFRIPGPRFVARGQIIKPDPDEVRKAMTLNAADRKAIEKDYREFGTIVGDTFFEGTSKSKGLQDQFLFFDTKILGQEMRDTLGSLVPQARQAALDAMVAHTRQLEKSGQLPKGATARIVKKISDELGVLPSNFRKTAKDSVEAIARELRRNDAVKAAEKLRQDLAHHFQGFPKLATTTGHNAATNFAKEIEWLRWKVAHTTGPMKKQAEDDLHAVQKAANKWGKRAKEDLFKHLDDMGVKGQKKANHVKTVVNTAMYNMATGVGASAQGAAAALYFQLEDMGLNADKILKSLGIKTPNVRLKPARKPTLNILPKSNVFTKGPFAIDGQQRGSYIPGKGDGDRHPILAESGEYVLNKKAVRAVGKDVLDQLNFNMFPRFARGGGINWNGHPPLHGAIANAVGTILRRYPGLSVSSTLRNTITRSGNQSNHNFGIAADISGAPAVMLRAAAWIKHAMGKSLVEGIHQPNLSIKGGVEVPASFWGAATWADHINHIHIALRDLAGGGLPGAAMKLLGQITATGRDGSLKRIALRHARRVRGAINRFLAKKQQDQGGGDTQSYGGGVLSEKEVRQVAQRALSILGIRTSRGLWTRALVRQAYNESTFNPNARNDTAAGRAAGGPKGLMQVVDGTFATYKYKGYGNVFHAIDNMLAAIRYVIARYGGGNSDRGAAVLWGRGGGAYAAGGEIPGAVGQPVPVLAHAKEWILNPLQQSAVARWSGTTVGKLKNALGFSGSNERGFQGGGDVGDSFFKTSSVTDLFTTKAEQDRIRKIRLGIFRLPAIPLRSWEDVVREAHRAMRALGHIGDAWRQRIKDINQEISDIRKNLTKEDKEKIAKLKKGGVTDKEAKQIAEIRGDITDAEKKKIAALQKERAEIRPSSDRIRAINKQIENIREHVSKQDEERIKALRKGGVTAKEAREIARIQADITKEEQKKIDALKDERHELRKHPGRRRRQPSARARIQVLDQLTREGGVLDTLDAQREVEAQEALDQRVIGLPPGTLRRDRTRRRREQQQVNQIRRRIRKLRADGVTRRERERIKELRRELDDERDDLREAQQQLREDRGIQARRLFRIVRGARGRVRRIIQRRPRGGRTIEQDQARFEQQQARINVRRIEQEQGFVGDALGDAEKRLRRLQRGGVSKKEAPEVAKLNQQVTRLRDRGAKLRQEQAEGVQALFEAQVKSQEADVNRINQRAERRTGRVERGRRIAEALGRSTATFDQGQINIMNQQASELEKQVARAKRMGNTEMAQQLQDQIAELRTSVIELTQQMLQSQIDQINEQAQRRLGRLDLFGRLADALGRVGLGGAGVSIGGQVLTRQGVFQQRQEVLAQQRAGLANVLAQQLALPVSQRNLKAIESLTDQIFELDVTMAENTKALFNARVEDVNARAQLQLGRQDRALRIQELTEQLGGVGQDTAARQRILGERAATLETQRQGLQQLLDEAIRGGDQQAIDDLTDQLADNRIATLENSVALKDLTAAQTQDWSSSAWQMFRNAIFTGAGQLLPQYVVPTAQTGAYVRRSGLVNVHAGEVIGHPERLMSGARNGDNYDVCVNIETPMEVADPVDLGNRIGYRLANNPNTR